MTIEAIHPAALAPPICQWLRPPHLRFARVVARRPCRPFPGNTLLHVREAPGIPGPVARKKERPIHDSFRLKCTDSISTHSHCQLLIATLDVTLGPRSLSQLFIIIILSLEVLALVLRFSKADCPCFSSRKLAISIVPSMGHGVVASNRNLGSEMRSLQKTPSPRPLLHGPGSACMGLPDPG
jgi:hypothetical protein